MSDRDLTICRNVHRSCKANAQKMLTSMAIAADTRYGIPARSVSAQSSPRMTRAPLRPTVAKRTSSAFRWSSHVRTSAPSSAEDLRHRAETVDLRRAGTRSVGGRHFDLTVSRDARPRGEFEPEVVPRVSHAPGDGLGDLRPHDAEGTRHVLGARVEQQAFEASQDPRGQGAVERLGPVGPPGLDDVRHARLEFGPEAFEVPRIILTVAVEEQEERELFRVDRENRVADRAWIALAIRGRRNAEGWHRFRDFPKHLAGAISTSVLEYE